jgi:3-methyladenine DNA glycosylase/8-oxoguanine DNA glycosylase
MRVRSDGVWRATRSPGGPATVHFEPDGNVVGVEAWGEGAVWALENAEGLIGANDDPSPLESRHPLISDLQRRLPGVRLPSWPTVTEILIPTVLEQAVVAKTARDAYRQFVFKYGEPAPGPLKLWLPPPPKTFASLPYYAFHPVGVEKRRADIVRRVCMVANRLESALAMTPEPARAHLMKVHGVGAWSAAEVARVAWGDADAVSVNDFHLPHTVSWALAGEPRGNDERMLELLEPYAGQRARVVRLIEAAGIVAPRFGPRMAIRPIAHI